MTKEEFNKLEVLEQLEFINNLLAEGKSLRIISSNLGMSKTTFRDRFIKIGYIYDANTNQYIKNNNLNSHLNKESLKTTKKAIDSRDIETSIQTSIETQQATKEVEKPQDINMDDYSESINKELINTLLEQLKVKDLQIHELDERLKQEQELNKNNQVLQIRQPQEIKQLEKQFALVDEKLTNIKVQFAIKESPIGFLKRMFTK